MKKSNAKTIYATSAKYSQITLEHIEQNRIESYTPFFKIDTKIDKWEKAIKAVEVIVSQLEKEGVEKSVYLLWSGKGIHVRINENAIPKDFGPLTAAHAIVQYVLREVRDEIIKIGDVKVDELIDPKRVFTVPLSPHKELDYVTVCFSPDKLSKFSLDWANPDSFIHEERVYERYEKDEAKELIERALMEYKPSHEGVKPKKEETAEGKIVRFQVMDILEAARYYVLYGDLDKAKSFGLNRAIFYAWAKYYGREYVPKGSKTGILPEIKKSEDKISTEVTGESVYQDVKTGYYIIGDKPQIPEDYDKEIKNK
ncbi:hypothetical protein [Saccharolobus islandicus]|uniref:Uncharacterized protein n=2 Tax=Saccharolobus islandicus TaxID=43080 RepID=C4KDZ0_SACI6|nr:hypothetical protein [Sulfolobus islandicus]ACP54466.1 conserved hypothetical protein [Sulfolobus islandicus M.16.27]ACR41113.1 conserved hypothetical protein [Sulfolobus islandicus M.16.4]